MNDFLNSLRSDMSDRRFLPVLALLVVALLAALAYAVLGSGSSTAPTPSSIGASSPATGATGAVVISQAPSGSDKAIAETTSGASEQHAGHSGHPRNPFTPLPAAKPASAATSSTSGSSSSSGSSSASGSSTPSSEATTPAATPKPNAPSKPAKPKTVYHVAVLFGALPATTPLTSYENLKLLTPLPSAKQALIVFRGVTAGGASATFTVVGEAILHGEAACLPSALQCEAIDLKPGQSEQLEYLPPAGQPVTYELKIVSIASGTASSAAVKNLLRGASKAGGALLSHDGLQAIPYLRHSSQAGVLVFAGHRAFAGRSSRARARIAEHGRHRP